MQYTTNYNLKKPEGTDPVLVGDLNDNSDTIDGALENLNTAIGGLGTAVSGKEDAANKTQDIGTNTASTTLFPSAKAVADYVATEIGAAITSAIGGSY